jgi:hypothetical protein
MGRAQDGGHGSAPRAQVHGAAEGREERDGTEGQRLGVRPGHEHAGVDEDAEVAEAHGSGYPGQRLPTQPAGDQLVDRSAADAGCPEQRIGLLARSEAATFG